MFGKKEVRRYNFIVGTHCLYSGLFEKNGWFDFSLAYSIGHKREKIAKAYGISIDKIKVSNTLKN